MVTIEPEMPLKTGSNKILKNIRVFILSIKKTNLNLYICIFYGTFLHRRECLLNIIQHIASTPF